MAVNKRKIQRIIDEVIVPVTEQTVSPTITHTSEVESQEMTDARKPQVSETVIVQSQADVPHGTPFLNIYGQIEQAGSEAPLHNLLEVAAELLNGYNPGWNQAIVSYAKVKGFPQKAQMNDCKRFLSSWSGQKLS